MPIYEYECPHCGVFEVTQRITEDSLRKCPTCSRKVRKLISNTSFQLKGSGWYVTDYARKGTAKESSTESKGTTDSTSSGESKAATESGGAKSESSGEKKGSEAKPAASKRGGKTDAKAHAA